MKTRIQLVLSILLLPMFCLGQIPLKINLQEKKHKTFCAAYSPDGKYIATGGMDKTVVIWNVNNGSLYKKIEGLKSYPYCVVFDKSSQYVAFGGDDRIVSIYNINTGQLKNTLKGHKGAIKTIAFSPDSKYIASSGDDEIIKLWDVGTGNLVNDLTGHEKQVNGLDFNYNGTRLVSGSGDKHVIIWDVNKGIIERNVVAHTNWVRDVAYSPDGKYIASCGDDKIINIWDAKRLELVNTFRAHKNVVMDISFSPDGNYLISGSHDNKIVLFDLRNGSILFQSPKQESYVLSVDFNPNGQDFVSINLFGEEISVWDASSLKITQEAIAAAKNAASLQQTTTSPPQVSWVSPSASSMEQASAVISLEASISNISDLITVQVYVNNKLYATDKKEDVASDIANNVLNYKRNVFLKSGQNTIKLIATNSTGSTNSDVKTITYKVPQKPQIAWISPGSGQTTVSNSSVDIAASITSHSTIDKLELYVNNAIAGTQFNISTSEANDFLVNFEKNITLQEGVNSIEIIASNNAGSVNSQPLQITYTKQQRVVPQVEYKAPPNPYRFALVIGNENYSSYQVGLESESDVDFAKNDAEEFHKYAIQYLGVPEDQAILLLNARYIEMRRALKKIAGVIEMTDGKAEIFFYYAGHGYPHEKTKEAYLVPVDGSGTDLEFSAIKLEEVYNALTEFPSKRVTVFIDACFSGGARNGSLVVGARAVKVKPKEVQLDKKLVVFTASSGEETSLPYKEKEHGLFTYYLLEKISETRGYITYKDLSDFIREQVGVKSYMVNSKKQEPQTNISPSIIGEWEEYKLR